MLAEIRGGGLFASGMLRLLQLSLAAAGATEVRGGEGVRPLSPHATEEARPAPPCAGVGACGTTSNAPKDRSETIATAARIRNIERIAPAPQPDAVPYLELLGHPGARRHPAGGFNLCSPTSGVAPVEPSRPLH